jgi:FixJ family two-component response regulator
MVSHKDVDIPTYDGLKLKGTLFSVGQKMPCIIMSSGVSQASFVILSSQY